MALHNTTFPGVGAMFVQTARTLLSNEKCITLTELAASTIYFSDRHERPTVGYMSTEDFVDMWGKGDDSFADNPPHAVLSYLKLDDHTSVNIDVVLHQPRLELNGQAITYEIEMPDNNTLPLLAGSSTLFIDSIN